MTTTSQRHRPQNTEGKRIAARNATTHGLFARDVVLPRLGEDPAGLPGLPRQNSPASSTQEYAGAALRGEDRRRLLAPPKTAPLAGPVV